MDTNYALELRCAEALARDAGHLMLRRRTAGFKVDYKGANDLVTDVDRAVEAFLRDELRTLFPDDGLNGEEFGASGSTARRWLIDPIDGTTNFSLGLPNYCVSIALQVDGQSVVGVVYEPNRDELFSARLGGGAHLNGEPIGVSARDELAQATLVTGFPPLKQGDDFESILRRLMHVMGGARGVRRLGSAAIDLAYVAAGRIDGYWEFNLKPWDTAAGYLLVHEAGGRTSDIHGNIFTAHEPSVVATNGLLHEHVLERLTSAP